MTKRIAILHLRKESLCFFKLITYRNEEIAHHRYKFFLIDLKWVILITCEVFIKPNFAFILLIKCYHFIADGKGSKLIIQSFEPYHCFFEKIYHFEQGKRRQIPQS